MRYAALLVLVVGCADAPPAVDRDTTSVEVGKGDDPRALMCLGASVPLTFVDDLPYVDVAIGPDHGAFLVDWGTTASAIDPYGFAPNVPTPVDGTADHWRGFDFFGPWSEVVLGPQDLSGFGGIREAGIMGTDFLSLATYVVDWDSARLARADCSESELTEAGFVALSTEGYYADDLGRIGLNVPNVPTIPVRIGRATAPAQIDTGYDDALAGPAVNINRAFFDEVAATLVRDPSRDLVLTTCVPGLVEHVDAYRSEGVTLVGVAGNARTEADAIIFVKDTPSGARHCGGIGTWDTPAAQLGVSFMANAGVVIFDAARSLVWLRRDESPLER